MLLGLSFIVFIGLFWLSVAMFRGTRRSWIEMRRRPQIRGWAVAGWPCFTAASGLVVLAFAFSASGQEELIGVAFPWLLIVAAILVACGFLFSVVGAPALLLPAWVRERREQGDPMTTGLPPRSLRGSLRHPMNHVARPEDYSPADLHREYVLKANSARYARLALTFAVLVAFLALLSALRCSARRVLTAGGLWFQA